MNTEIQTMEQRQVDRPLSVGDLLAQVNLIQEVMRAVMKEGEHFGKIPGCGDKPTLLQPGAQKLLVTFRLAPEYAITEKTYDKGHREYQILCTLKTIGSGSFVGQGAGSASTLEGKWRFRVAPKKLTDRQVPKEYWDLRKTDPKAAQQSIGGPGFGTKKDDNGSWMITEGSNEKVEHDNPADYYNTVLKMACKRAQVAAVLTATAASDIFTQDIEELQESLSAAQETTFQQNSPKTPAPTPVKSANPQPEHTKSVPEEDNLRFDDAEPAGPKPPEINLPDGDEVIGLIEAISYKSGKTPKGPWNKVSIKVNNEWYQSFSDTVAAGAEEIKRDRKSARIIYTEVTSGQYTNKNIEYLIAI